MVVSVNKKSFIYYLLMYSRDEPMEEHSACCVCAVCKRNFEGRSSGTDGGMSQVMSQGPPSNYNNYFPSYGAYYNRPDNPLEPTPSPGSRLGSSVERIAALANEFRFSQRFPPMHGYASHRPTFFGSHSELAPSTPHQFSTHIQDRTQPRLIVPPFTAHHEGPGILFMAAPPPSPPPPPVVVKVNGDARMGARMALLMMRWRFQRAWEKWQDAARMRSSQGHLMNLLLRWKMGKALDMW